MIPNSMNDQRRNFKEYLAQKENRNYLWAALLIGIGYFIALRYLYPVPSFYSDSYTWVGAARTGQPVSFRPVGYSKMMMFFRLFSRSDFALIAGQYFSNLTVNLFLFFSATFFFAYRKGVKLLLYLLLVLNPFYLFYSNYIASDPFFNCFTVLWFTLLIWMMYRPSWLLIVSEIALLAAMFELRYNALFFPAVSTLPILLSRMTARQKAVGIAGNVVVIAAIILITTYVTRKYTGTKTFSAFSGWQMANDALHVMQHGTIDTTRIKDKEVRALTRFTMHFFDTARQTFPDSGATAVFMWHINSPLKKYMRVFPGRSRSYFKTWNTLGPVYSSFGKTIILQKPFVYLEHFVLPNTKAFIFPPLEIYEKYMEGNDTIAAAATKYYGYKSKKAPPHHPVLYTMIFTPMLYIFIMVNVIFVFGGTYYFICGKYKYQPLLFNHTLLCFTAFYFANFFFIIFLAPTVFRYHIFILTLSFPILLYMVQQFFFRTQRVSVASVKANNSKEAYQ